MNIPAFTHHVGSTERAFVAHVNDLNDFYLNSESIHESLVNLGKDLYNEYSQSYTKPLGNNEKLHIGDYCACPSESEDWYRGLIRQIDSHGHAMVFKIDYGDVQCIPIQFLRPLKERFFKLHRLASHCSLVNLVKPNDGWSSDIIEEFRSRLTTTFLYAKFINYNEIRDISEVEITEKSSKIPLNKDFESHQVPRSTTQMNDKLLYKYIPMETLDLTQPSQIRLLYYISPARFYVYLQEKSESHLTFQSDLQKEVQNLRPLSSPKRYQTVAVQDNHAVWHRAIVLDNNPSTTTIYVFLTDIGQRERISVDQIRQLPEGFQYNPAFAIPCCLNNVSPSNGTDASVWKAIDSVHEEFNRLMVNIVTCQVRDKQELLYYTVDIDISKLGDLSTFLVEKNLVSRPSMRTYQRPNFTSGQGSNQSFVRAQLQQSGTGIRQPQQRHPPPNDYPQNSNNIRQQPTSRMPNTGSQAFNRQPPPSNVAAAANTSPPIPVLAPQDGTYKIIQVRNATEFYGLPQTRENEFAALSERLARHYNNDAMSASFGASIFFLNYPYVFEQDNQYHRVVMIRRESDTRICIKLVDRGDEILVDTTELLNIHPDFCSIPEFAQPFRLDGFDESKHTAAITSNLKKTILNQMVVIKTKGPMINGFYPVEVKFNERSVNQALLSNEKIPPMTLVSATSRQNNTNPQPPTHFETKVFNNSNRYHPVNQDTSGRSDARPRPNDVLHPPQKVLTGPPRAQTGRFGDGSPSNEPPSRVTSFNNTNQRSQPNDSSSSSNNAWNPDRNNQQNYNNTGGSNQPPFGRQQSNPSQFNPSTRNDESQSAGYNNSGRFPSNNFGNQQRSSGGGFGQDERNDRQGNGSNDSGSQRGGFSNRGGYNSDRGGRGGFSDRNNGRNNQENQENNSQFSERGYSRGGGFSDRGGSGGFSDRGGSGGFSDRGGRGGDYQDRNNFDRNSGDDRGHGYNSDRGRGGDRGRGYNNDRSGGGGRGGYQNRYEQGDNGNFRGRGSRGGPRGGFGDNSRGGYGKNGNDDIQLSSDTVGKSFSGWTGAQSTPKPFEAGDRFVDTPIPSQTLKYVVSHIETPNQFYIQLLSKGGELSALTESLQTEYKQAPEVNISSFEVNQPCLAKFTDLCWYRATVLTKGLTQLKVRFVDFGNTCDVDSKTIRQISKKQCIEPPYGYQCTFENAQAVDNVNTDIIIQECANKEFEGKIVTKTSDGKFILQSDEWLNLLLKINAIKVKLEKKLKRIKCLISHIESAQHEFFIQDDDKTLSEIADLIEGENSNATTLSLDEVKDLKAITIVIARYDDLPFRGILQSDESDENVNIFFVDYGNISACPKDSLKQCSEKLNAYPYQAKRCHLYGVSTEKIGEALEYLDDNTDPEIPVEISIVKEKDQIYDVLVYVDDQCVNEKFGYDPNQDQEETTVQEEQEQQKTEDAVETKENAEPSNEDNVPKDETPAVSRPSDEDIVPEDDTPAASQRSSEDALPEDDTPAVSRPSDEDIVPEDDTPAASQRSSEDALPKDETPVASQPSSEDALPKEETPVASQPSNEDVMPKNETPIAFQPSEREEFSSKYHHGTLAYIETSKPYVYIQSSLEMLDQINELIDNVREENKHNTSYEIGEHVVAKFNDDEAYYRARIQSYSSTSQLYTVYFVDYGNIDENVNIDDIYLYTDQLKEIEALAHGYLLEGISSEAWNTTVRSLVDEYLNTEIEFYYTDENQSTIHIKFENENDIYNVEQPSAPTEQVQENISGKENDCFYTRVSSNENLEESLSTCPKEQKDSWSINDLCLVSNEEGKYLRGEILAINDDKYDVKCIDYGYNLSNIPIDRLYALPDGDIFKQSALAHQCPLNDQEDITTENDPNESCSLVKQVQENNEIVKDRIEDETKPESDKEEIVAPLPEASCEKLNSTNLIENNSFLSITNNQTIDFGENDPSTTIKDDTNNSFLSN